MNENKKVSEAKRRAIRAYDEKTYQRVTFRVRKADWPAIKAHIEESGESLNGFILAAILERMARQDDAR